MKQGKLSVTKYGNEFRLVTSEAKWDHSTGEESLLGGMNTKLHNARGASSKEYDDLHNLGQWAIGKKAKLATVRHFQGSP